MGIKGLMKLIGDEAPSCVKEGEMKNYFGRKIAVDASMWYVGNFYFLISMHFVKFVSISDCGASRRCSTDE